MRSARPVASIRTGRPIIVCCSACPSSRSSRRWRCQALAATEAARPWVVAVDDSITRKTGRCIPGCGWRKDPLGPPFNVNFVWGQRVLQFSAAIPAGDGSARLVPVDWQEAPMPKKPARQAGPQTQAAYLEARKQANLNLVAAARMARLREATGRRIHFVSDGRFTNRTLLRRLPENTVLIGRVRKDTVLYAPCAAQPGRNGRPRRYGQVLPTPETTAPGRRRAVDEGVGLCGGKTTRLQDQGLRSGHGPYHRGAYAGARSGDRPARLPTAQGRKAAVSPAGLSALHRCGAAGAGHPPAIPVALGHRSELQGRKKTCSE
ncbi:hypothetical protein Ga0100231_022165 [Opitutaceae bacterium TAV4]|nr:hypothetical protein Ga0100231_022165 [Opitutaceae bacterium TAV4]